MATQAVDSAIAKTLGELTKENFKSTFGYYEEKANSLAKRAERFTDTFLRINKKKHKRQALFKRNKLFYRVGNMSAKEFHGELASLYKEYARQSDDIRLSAENRAEAKENLIELENVFKESYLFTSDFRAFIVGCHVDYAILYDAPLSDTQVIKKIAIIKAEDLLKDSNLFTIKTDDTFALTINFIKNLQKENSSLSEMDSKKILAQNLEENKDAITFDVNQEAFDLAMEYAKETHPDHAKGYKDGRTLEIYQKILLETKNIFIDEKGNWKHSAYEIAMEEYDIKEAAKKHVIEQVPGWKGGDYDSVLQAKSITSSFGANDMINFRNALGLIYDIRSICRRMLKKNNFEDFFENISQAFLSSDEERRIIEKIVKDKIELWKI